MTIQQQIDKIMEQIDEIMARGYSGTESPDFLRAMRRVDLLEEKLNQLLAAKRKINQSTRIEKP